ncbi:hypothetical protein KR059_000406 [Drosophila kikkawai]|nr:hypothetical protein KR059_000406 [Drosophila kikkawai]
MKQDGSLLHEAALCPGSPQLMQQPLLSTGPLQWIAICPGSRHLKHLTGPLRSRILQMVHPIRTSPLWRTALARDTGRLIIAVWVSAKLRRMLRTFTLSASKLNWPASAAQTSCFVEIGSILRTSKTRTFESSVVARTDAVSPSTFSMLSLIVVALSALPFATSRSRLPLLVRRTFDTQRPRSDSCLSSLLVTIASTSL